ncbi:MAG: IMP cyclohydrolase [Lachnospiraceae bacterium]|nr:IMP cyclohydrolase [Lachnospiraceae bacterium]
MEMRKLKQELADNTYPGRGIVIGLTPDGAKAVTAYFIMGRSVNSRNRIFVEDGEGIRTQAHDPSKLGDPSLIIYAPVRVYRKDGTTYMIVTNGDQTDTVYEGLKKGLTFEQCLQSREFEPDAPNYTPRISGLLTLGGGDYRYALSILKCMNPASGGCARYTFDYDRPIAGEGHFIHTYRQDGEPLPSFEGEPKRVRIPGDIDVFAENLWSSLHQGNKVSLFVRYTDLKTGTYETRIINKNE